MVKSNLERIMLRWSGEHGIKLTLEMLAEATGLTTTILSRIKNDDREGIKYDHLDLLCEVLDCEPGDLFIRVPNEPRRTKYLTELKS